MRVASERAAGARYGPVVVDAQSAEAEEAEAAEAALDENPGQRGQWLVRAGEAWNRAGEPERARPLLAEAVGFGGEVGGMARAELAGVLLDLARAEEAAQQLDQLWQESPASPAPYRVAAEVLAEFDAPERALEWIEHAVGLVGEPGADELALPEDVEAEPAHPLLVLAARWRIRDQLDLPEDEVDRSTSELLDTAELTGEVESTDEWENPQAPTEVRVVFWPRGQGPRARELWPGLDVGLDAEAAAHEREWGNRELAEAGYARVEMVPLSTSDLGAFAERSGDDPADGEVVRACADELADRGAAFTWPPERNAACWCGSTEKYKKCCGRPVLD